MLQLFIASVFISSAIGYDTNSNAFGTSASRQQTFGQHNIHNQKIATFGASQSLGALNQAKPKAQLSKAYNQISGGFSGASQNFAATSQGFGSRAYAGNSLTPGQNVQAAIQTIHNIEYRDVESTGSVNPTTIEVGASPIPITFLFRSASSNLNVQQAHDGAQGSVQESSSEDEPHVLKHSVNKPIIQELREIITPYRKINQEIQPVQEQVLTIVSRAHGNGYKGAVNTESGLAGSTHVGNNLASLSSDTSYGITSGANNGAAYRVIESNLGNNDASLSSGSSFGITSEKLTGLSNFGNTAASAGYGTVALQKASEQY